MNLLHIRSRNSTKDESDVKDHLTERINLTVNTQKAFCLQSLLKVVVFHILNFLS